METRSRYQTSNMNMKYDQWDSVQGICHTIRRECTLEVEVALQSSRQHKLHRTRSMSMVVLTLYRNTTEGLSFVVL